MKRLLLPLLVLASGLCHGQSSPAFSFSSLPEWESSASGPLRPTNSVPAGGGSGGLGDLVVTCDNFEISAYSHVGPINGQLRFTVPFETAQGWTGYVLEGHTPPTDPGGCTSEEYIICDPATGGNLVMMWNYGSEFLSISGLYTDEPTVQNYFGSYTGTLVFSRESAGPPDIDLETVDPLLPSSRNWYRSWLIATNPPAPPVGPIVVDTLVLPVGIYSPIRDQPSALVEAIVAEPSMLKAIVQRYRSGLAPTNIPVTVAHSPTNVVGSVSNLWWVEGEGVWARLRVSSVIYGSHASCEVYGLRAQATDAWGTWGDFFLPWQIRAVSLVAKPALATPVAVPLPAEPAAPYPGRIHP